MPARDARPGGMGGLRILAVGKGRVDANRARGGRGYMCSTPRGGPQEAPRRGHLGASLAAAGGGEEAAAHLGRRFP